MEKDQREMSKRFPNFIQGLGNLDWQMGFTTTDLQSKYHNQGGRLLRLEDKHGELGDTILTPSFSNANEIFLNTVQRKETIGCYYGDTPQACPTVNEQPLKASIMAMLQKDSENRGFFRPNADLHVVILSDEDEMSNGQGEGLTTGQMVKDAFDDIFGSDSGKELRIHSIIIKPGDRKCKRKQACQMFLCLAGGNYGCKLKEASDLTEGKVGSICDKNFGKTLKGIGEDANQLARSFKLAHKPVPSSVKVTLSGGLVIPYKVEGMRVVFDQTPPPYTKITISYQKAN